MKTDECLQLAAELSRIPSANPPGQESAIADFVEQHLHNSGLSTRRLELAPGRPSVLGRLPGRGKTQGAVVFCAHLDTVAAEEPSWTVEPFAATEREGKLFGRGAADMKTGLACLLLLARRLAAGPGPERELLFAFTADEEGGYGGAASLRQAGWLDAARLLLITEPTAGQVYLGQKGELWIDARFSGRAMHGSVPELGQSALLPACRFALDLVAQISNLPAGPDGSRTSINLGEFHAGWQVNVVPDEARLKLDVRVASRTHRDEVLHMSEALGRELARQSRTRFAQQIFMDQAPIHSDPRHPLVQTFLRAAEQVRCAPIHPEICPYSTDGVAIAPQLGIPLIIYGPGSIAQAHQPDEYIRRDAVEEPGAVLETFAASL